MKKWLLRGGAALGVLAIGMFIFLRSIGMFATQPVYTANGVALGGTDVVAYFTDGKPTPGVAEFVARWNGAQWHFASAAHRDQFIAAPERYAPQFGGYCAYAVSHEYTAKTDPAAWSIVDGKLFLNFDLDTQKEWLADRDRFIADGHRNWPGVLW